MNAIEYMPNANIIMIENSANNIYYIDNHANDSDLI